MPPALPRRKNLRMAGWDYQEAGIYFVTICAKDMQCLFGHIRAAIDKTAAMRLSPVGQAVHEAIDRINGIYGQVTVNRHVIMPNHPHMLLVLGDPSRAKQPTAPPLLRRVVGQMKRAVSARLGFPVWKRSFHDHVVRDEDDLRFRLYMELNPSRWAEDRFCQPE